MEFIRIKNLIKAYKNAYVYNDLIHAKEKLLNLNIQIEKKQREIKILEEVYSERKNKISLAFLEIDKKLEDSIYMLLDKFNDKLKSELEKENLSFEIYYKNPTDLEIEALKFLEVRLNEENFQTKLSQIEVSQINSRVVGITMFVAVKNFCNKSKKTIKINYE